MSNIHDTITNVAAKLERKEVTALELVEESLKVISEKNPEINAILEVTANQAKEIASNVDQGVPKNLISGIPTTIKDNFNLVGTHTTASSNILRDYISPYTATVIQRLVDQNAPIVGKSNLDAFAHGSSTETSDFGVTKNPHDVTRVAGGSSGGSAAAVAAGMVTYAIGSETAGSVRGPASWCGIYGFVPTYGRFSRYGVIAMGSSLDRPGVLANSVRDCAIVSDVMGGHDGFDATSIPESGPLNYAENLNAKVSGGLRVGVPKQFMDERIDLDVRVRVEEGVKNLEKLGAKIVEIDLLDPKYAIAVYTIVCRSEVSSNLARIDGIRYGHFSDQKAESILDQIALNRGEGFGNEAKQRSMTGAYALSSGYYDAYYKKAQRVRTLIIEDFKRAFQEVDLIVGPTMPSVAPKIGASKDNPLFGELSDMLAESSALAGLPCISIPVGSDAAGLPIGMQIFGPQFHEQQVLDLAYAYEQNILI